MSIPGDSKHSQLHSAQRRLFSTGGEPPQEKAKQTKAQMDKVVGELHKAAEQGDSDAQFQLGLMYEEGTKVRKNENTARQWYRLAAEREHAEAQFNLGRLMQDKNAVESLKWWLEADSRGHNSAALYLGRIYVGGGVAILKDPKAAVKWFLKAADPARGFYPSAEAQLELGHIYRKGDGVPKNEAEAVKWYRRAAYQGHSIAESWLHGMNRRQQVERPGSLR